MTEFSDYTSSYIIILLLIVFYFYLLYLKMNIITENDWSSIQCTPLYMLVGTLMGKGTDENIFQKCVKKNTKKELQNRQLQNMKKNEENVDYNTRRMNSLLDTNDNSIKNKQTELLKLVDDSNYTVSEVVDKQNKINAAIMDSASPIKDIMSKVEGIVDSGKGIFDKVNEPKSS